MLLFLYQWARVPSAPKNLPPNNNNNNKLYYDDHRYYTTIILLIPKLITSLNHKKKKTIFQSNHSMSPPTPPCLSNCTSQELSQYLLHRFNNDSTKTATFLLESLDKVPNIEEINDNNLNQQESNNNNYNNFNNDNNGEEESDFEKDSILGAQIKSIPQNDDDDDDDDDKDDDKDTSSSSSSNITVSAVAPRSKFTLTMYEKGCIMTNNKNEQILLHRQHIKHVIMFPKREDCVKAPKLNKTSNKTKIDIPGSIILLLLVKDKVNFRNKVLSQVCFQLPQHLSQSTHDDPRKLELAKSKIVDEFESKWEELFKSSFQKDIVRIYNPRFNQLARTLNTFQSDGGNPDSSMIQGGMPYVKCFKGEIDLLFSVLPFLLSSSFVCLFLFGNICIFLICVLFPSRCE